MTCVLVSAGIVCTCILVSYALHVWQAVQSHFVGCEGFCMRKGPMGVSHTVDEEIFIEMSKMKFHG